MKPQTWVEVDAYAGFGPLGYSGEPANTGTGLRGEKGDYRRTEKLVEGEWLVRWWKRIR